MMTKAQRKENDAFLSVVLAALGCVYCADAQVLAEDIVMTVGTAGLLRVAKREEDISLSDLRRTIRELKRRERITE